MKSIRFVVLQFPSPRELWCTDYEPRCDWASKAKTFWHISQVSNYHLNRDKTAPGSCGKLPIVDRDWLGRGFSLLSLSYHLKHQIIWESYLGVFSPQRPIRESLDRFSTSFNATHHEKDKTRCFAITGYGEDSFLVWVQILFTNIKVARKHGRWKGAI